MGDDNLDTDLAAIGSLTDPTRRRLYGFVSRSIEPVGRDEAADALGIPRQTAAYHLDRLADEGLVDVEFLRLSGRTGPGAGRPAKLYKRTRTIARCHCLHAGTGSRHGYSLRRSLWEPSSERIW